MQTIRPFQTRLVRSMGSPPRGCSPSTAIAVAVGARESDLLRVFRAVASLMVEGLLEAWNITTRSPWRSTVLGTRHETGRLRASGVSKRQLIDSHGTRSRMKSLSRSQTAFIGGSAALDAAGSTSVGMSAVLSAGTPCRLRTGGIPFVLARKEGMRGCRAR